MASSSSSLLLLLLFLLLFFSFSSSLPHDTVLDAADILSDSGYVSMSLTLQLLSQTLLLSHPSSLTIFAPSDSSFSKFGQPSLDLLRFHFSPLSLPPLALRLLPAGTDIPTMLYNHSLVVTTSRSNRGISLNNVEISGSSPIYDSGIFLIYGIDKFFDPNFQHNLLSRTPCSLKSQNASSSGSFDEAIETLRSSGYSVTASFLGLQLNRNRGDEAAMTVFAPKDEMAKNNLGDFNEYPSFFLRHVVPCKLLWNDLVDFNHGSLLPTLLKGFSINITRSNGVLVLNGVPVFFPDLFYNDKVVVHGIGDVLVAHHQNHKIQEVEESYSDVTGRPFDEEILNDSDEF